MGYRQRNPDGWSPVAFLIPLPGERGHFFLIPDGDRNFQPSRSGNLRKPAALPWPALGVILRPLRSDRGKQLYEESRRPRP